MERTKLMTLTVTEKEKEFTLAYHTRIKQLQDKCEEGIIVYTKITLSFALLHDLQFIELVFHPKSIAKCKNYEKPDFSREMFKETLEAIIIYELNQSIDKGRLTQEELQRTIEHFRSFDQKKLS